MKRAIFFFVLILICANLANAEQFFLKQTMYEGESRNYNVGSYVYTIKLTGVFDTQQKAQFEVNGETTDALGEDESDKLSDGAVIQVRDILPQESGDGKDLVQFNFFPAAHEVGEQPAAPLAKEPEPAAKATSQPLAEQEKAVVSPSVQPSGETVPAPQKSTVDITKREPTKSAWERFVAWLKGLFG